jgi:hypothetical protein
MFKKHTEEERDLIVKINEKRQQILGDDGDEASSPPRNEKMYKTKSI